MSLPRVVLDTNVVLSTVLFRSSAVSWLRVEWQKGSIQPLVSRATTTELLRVLAYPKFALTADDREDLLADYLPWCEVVTIPADPPITPSCRDPHDQAFLELALQGAADALVTGDQDILVLKPQFSVAILTVAEARMRWP